MDLQLMLDHPTPVAGDPLRLRALLKVSGQVRRGGGRTPLSLALVLDRSGSMAGEKLRYAREAAQLLVRRVWPEDRVSVVAYDSMVETLAAGATGVGHAEASARIGRLGAGSLTNLSGGWLKGQELVEASRAEAGVNRVILMTDGLANEGITDPVALRELCRQSAARGISTTTIGFGQDFNEDLLQTMSDAGGGASYYIENPDQAPGIFEEEVEGLMGLAAQNVSVTVRAGADVQLAAIRHAYPASHTGGAVRLEMGDLYASEPRFLLMEWVLENPAPGAQINVGQLQVRGDVLTNEGGIERRTVDLPMHLVVGEGPRVDPEVRRVAMLLGANTARQRAMDLGDAGDADGAARVLESAALEMDPLIDEDAEMAQESKDLRGLAERMMAKKHFAAADVKYMKQKMYDNSRSRSAAKERYSRE